MTSPRFRLLLSFLAPHRRVLLLGLVLGLLANAAGLAAPLVTKHIIDTLETPSAALLPIAGLLTLVLVGAGISLWQWILLGSLAQRVVLDARASLVRHYFAARVAELSRRPAGELVTRATSDTALLHEASSSVVGIVTSSLGFVATLVLMGTLDPVLLGCTLTAVILVGAIMTRLLPTIGAAQEAAQQAVGELGGDLEGALRAIRTVKASRAEHRQTERIVALAGTVAAHGVRAVRRTAGVWSVSWTGIQLAIIAVLGIGAWRAQLGLLEISSLIAFLLYAFQLMGPINELTRNITALQAGMAAAARIHQVQAFERERDTPTVGVGTPRRDVDGPILALRDVTLAYAPDAAPAVRGITLDIARRGHTAIVGPSGAGKTTLFSLLLRFVEPQAGEILLDGQPYPALGHDTVRARLAYVEQETPLVPGTIRDNLLFTHPEATDDEVRTALRAVRLDAAVDALPDGWDTVLTSGRLSGGERQRLALARAILRTPDVLLLDEATAQVDGLTEAAVQDCIADRAAAGAVVTIAHRLSTVLDADRIVVLEAGRIRAQGTHADLLASDDLYRRLVQALRIATADPLTGASRVAVAG